MSSRGPCRGVGSRKSHFLLSKHASDGSRKLHFLLSTFAAVVLVFAASGCGGPCKQVQREWAAVRAARPPATEPHIRVQVPYAVANRLITDVLGEEIAVPIELGALGLLAPYVASLRAVVRDVALAPGPPGKVRFTLRVELSDAAGLLIALRAHADVEPVIETGADGRPPAVTLGLRADQLARLEPELGPRAAEALGTALLARIPADVGAKVPKFVVDRAAAKVVEELVERGHALLRDTLLVRLGDVTRLRFALPPIPIARIALTSVTDPVAALDLAIHTSLPVRAGVADATPAADAIAVHVAGSAAAELGNWGIAEGHLPQRYTRKLEPATDGPYTPHFDWRADVPARPLLVHMFARRGKGCAHFAAAARPHVRVAGGEVHAHLTNRRMEHSVGPPLLELLAGVNGIFQRSVSKTKSAAAQTQITVGGRDVRAELVGAEISADDIHASFTLSIAAAAPEAKDAP